MRLWRCDSDLRARRAGRGRGGVFSLHGRTPWRMLVDEFLALPQSVSPIWRARALFRANIDEFVPHTQHVFLRTVGQPESISTLCSDRHEPGTGT